jgi:hypothetical protein
MALRTRALELRPRLRSSHEALKRVNAAIFNTPCTKPRRRASSWVCCQSAKPVTAAPMPPRTPNPTHSSAAGANWRDFGVKISVASNATAALHAPKGRLVITGWSGCPSQTPWRKSCTARPRCPIRLKASHAVLNFVTRGVQPVLAFDETHGSRGYVPQPGGASLIRCILRACNSRRIRF